MQANEIYPAIELANNHGWREKGLKARVVGGTVDYDIVFAGKKGGVWAQRNINKTTGNKRGLYPQTKMILVEPK